MAEDLGYHVVALEAPEGQRLANNLAPALKGTLVRLRHVERAKEHVARAVIVLVRAPADR